MYGVYAIVIVKKVYEKCIHEDQKNICNSNFNFGSIFLMFSNNKFYFRHLGGSAGLANRIAKSRRYSSILVVLFIELLYVILCVGKKKKKPVLEETKIETESMLTMLLITLAVMKFPS